MSAQKIQESFNNPQTFKVDLNSIRDDNRAVALIGHPYVQLIPKSGDAAVAVDEDGAYYDATVDAVLEDGRVYLRLIWASKRTGNTFSPVTLGLPQCLVGAGSKT